MSAPLRYWRSRDGLMIHRQGCPSTPPFPALWNWAADKTPETILADLLAHGLHYRWCMKCFPNGAIS